MCEAVSITYSLALGGHNHKPTNKKAKQLMRLSNRNNSGLDLRQAMMATSYFESIKVNINTKHQTYELELTATYNVTRVSQSKGRISLTSAEET